MGWKCSTKIIDRIIKGDVEIFTSPEILLEYQNVLNRDFKYSSEETKKIIQKILSFISIILTTEKIDIIKDDPQDNKILECALSANANYILTYDTHLIKIKEYNKIKIVTPEQFRKDIK